jgi:hypothetical protein
MNKKNTYNTQGKLAATIALVLISVFVLLVVVLHFLRTELSPLIRAVSDYATGRYGFLMTTAFIALSAGLASMTMAAFRRQEQSILTQSELVMLSISSFLVLLAGIFPSEQPITIISMIHIMASFLFFLIIMVIMLKSSIRLQRDGMLYGKNKLLLWIAISSPILFILWLGVFLLLGLSGLGQRIYILSWVSWLMLLGSGIRDNAFDISNLN